MWNVPMKKYLILGFIIILILGCTKSNENIQILSKITSSDKKFSLVDFKNIGFKKSKNYNVKELPEATAVYYGFIKNNEGKPEDYEIRFYENHNNAINYGKKYADNATGKEACIEKDCVLWKEDLKHRQKISEPFLHMSGSAGNGIPIAKYLNYVVYGNIILMCPGYDQEDALLKCSTIVDKLNSN